MAHRIDKVLIVGGGTAGWMTASMLCRRRPQLSVTVVESPSVPKVGVGEATIIQMTEFLRDMGLGERDWMRGCNATYKEGIHFQHFLRQDIDYWHPFQNIQRELTDFWLHRYYREGLGPQQYFEHCFSNTVLNAANRVNVENKVNFDRVRQVSYSYHLDATRFGEFLKERIALPAGVAHVVDEVTEVVVGEDGFVDCVRSAGHGELRADLYVDCTGFRSLLLGQALGGEFIDYTDKLPNDRAIAVRMPYRDKEAELHPYTSATALEAGWVWNIPLWSRVGTGYVYSSAHKNRDQAEAELRRHLGEARVKDLDFHHIDMRIGRRRHPWHNNVVAVGLASGFIEPLESTGIELIQVGADFLCYYLESRDDNSAVTRVLYNKKMQIVYDEIADYIQLHFILSEREDTAYWRALKYDLHPLRDELLATLLRYESSFAQPPEGHVFLDTAWCALLMGFRQFPTRANLRPLDPESVPAANRFMDENLRHARESIASDSGYPSHHQFLRKHIYADEEVAP